MPPSSSPKADAAAPNAAGGGSGAITAMPPHVSLTAKPHAFAGAVLSPKHARELTPALVLSVTVSLAEQASATTSRTSAGGGASVGGASHAASHGGVHHGHTPSSASSVGGIPPAPPSLPNSPPSLGRRTSGSSIHSHGKVGSIANADLAFRTIQQTASTDSGFGGAGPPPMSPSAMAAKFYEQGGTVQYTVWITEAWRVLGWAEPSAALFWEMTTMYYTLYLAGRYSSAAAANAASAAAERQQQLNSGKGGGDAASTAAGGAGKDGSNIPPILSVGSNTSVGSGRSASTRQRKNTSDGDQSSGGGSNGSGSGTGGGGGGGTAALTDGLGSAPPTPRGGDAASVGSSPGRRPASPANSAVGSTRSGLAGHHSHVHQQNKPSGSAKELPVWMIGTYLLLHCEAEAYRRNLSGEDERRFGEGRATAAAASLMGVGTAGGVDFNALLMHPGLSPRTRLHAGQHTDNSHCTAYLLRHLRKFLLLTAVPHNVEAIWALSDLAERPRTLDPEYDDLSSRQGYPTLLLASGVDGAAPIPTARPDADELQTRHEQDHDVVGSNIRLTADDLERLSLVLQPQNGGLIDDPPLRIGDLLRTLVGDLSSSAVVPAPEEEEDVGAPGHPQQPRDGLLLADVEREIRNHLEHELRRNEDEDESTQDSDPTEAMAGLSIRDHGGDHEQSGADARLSRRRLQEMVEESQGYNKELSYTNLRGTTTLLKPNSHPDNRESPSAVPSSAESVSSSGGGGGSGTAGSIVTSHSAGRLHDLHISDCSDAHMYLLQPFEHATISACTGCTIVVGAVAGLLHVVDCERTTVTTAARRVLVSNCFDVLHCIFTPSPPLLVGDNRSCQFAPYNTYYDGLREDLLATGLAAALLNPDGTAYGGPDLPQPALQCSSNKWKLPVELAKLEIPQLPGAVSGSTTPTSASSSSSPHAGGVGADDKALTKGTDDNMQTPILLPSSEFHILFVPLESEAARQRRSAEEAKEMEVSGPGSSQDDVDEAESAIAGSSATKSSGAPMDSQYCRILADVIQLSPFRLPSDYERRALVKAERMKTLQAAMQTLTPAQKLSLEDELNRGFREWLVTSGNLRQVLDLVHMDRMT